MQSVTSSSFSAPVVPLQPPKKLDVTTVFKMMESRLCQVSSLTGRCTGVLLLQECVLVPFHALTLFPTGQIIDGKQEYIIPSVQISYLDTTFTAFYSQKQQTLDKCQYFDCAIFNIVDPDFPLLDPMDYDDSPIEVGTTVYYAGYPLTQQIPSFHKGRVSSVEREEHYLCFSIDGPVMPGNSGGPVFVQKHGALLFVGMIFAELANIDPNFIREKKSIKAQLSQSTFSISGLDYSALFSKMMDMAFDNLSTGIGKVLGIRHVVEVLSNPSTDLPPVPSPFCVGLPVTKEEYLPGHLGTDKVYRDWYHRRVKGKQLCITILGKSVDGNIDKQEEQVLWKYYVTQIKDHPTKGHKTFELTVEGQFENLRDKIREATPKALKTNATRWKETLVKMRTDNPSLENKINDVLRNLLE